MSEFNREKIEAVVRAFDSDPRQENWNLFRSVVDAPMEWWLPDGGDRGHTPGDALWQWLAHVRALDATNTAPVAPDPLDEVVWEDAARVATAYSGDEMNLAVWDRLSAHDMEAVRSCIAKTLDHVSLGEARRAVTAHARAQLARESAPVAPAMTLDAMREALTAAGYTVEAPKVGGFERADVALTRAEAEITLKRCLSAMSDVDLQAWNKQHSLNQVRDNLRGFGVAPATFS